MRHRDQVAILRRQKAEPGARLHPHRAPSWKLLGLAAALLIVAPAAWAVVVPQDDGGELGDLVVTEPTLQPTVDLAPLDAVALELEDDVRAAWSAFTAAQRDPQGWNAAIDRRSGLVDIAEGAGVPWIPGYGNDLALSDVAAHLRGRAELDTDALESIARSFLLQVAPLLGAEGFELRLDRKASGPYSDYLWFVEFDVYASGLKIEGARVFFRVNNGNLIQFGAEKVPAPGTPVPKALISLDQARAALDAYAGLTEGRDRLIDKGTLRLLPVAAGGSQTGYAFGRGYQLQPVWELSFRRGEEHPTWRARVDAVTGGVVEFRDVNHYAQVTGGYWPVSWRVGGTEQAQVITGWPYATVDPTGGTSNTSGIYAWDGSAQTARHVGPYVNINDQCSGAPGTASSGVGGDVAFGEILVPNAPGDCQDQNGINDNSPAARQQFWHLNKIMEKGRAYLPSNSWLQSQLTANVNIASNCNAFWNGSTVNFYTSGGGCGNTGEDAGISMHEWAHGMDSNDGNGTSTENGTGETYGDFTAALQTLDSCTGWGFLGGNCGGYGNPCTNCDGVRDLDWGRHTANAPMTVASFTGPNCPSDAGGGYVGPCGLGQGVPNDKEGHCESLVSSGALFDLAAFDLQAGCGTRNPAFPDWNCPGAGGPYSSAGAWGTIDRLWYLSRSTANQAFSCNIGALTSDGCNAGSNWRTLRAVDDDDGNLANGTPHACQIAAAFNRHGIGNSAGSSCAGDNTTCFRACPQPPTPSLNPATAGNNQITLGWTPNPSPDVIDVFRNEVGCSAGFTKVAEDLSGTLYVDNQVANGTTYYYQIVRHPAGNEACASAPSNCVSGTPVAGPSAKYVSDSATLTSVPADNDGDGFVDNCETGRIQVGIVNDGSGALTNVRFTVASPDAEITIASAMPVNVGSLAVSSSTTGTFDFDLDGATCGQTMNFDVSVTADEMSGSNLDAFTHGPVEQDLALTPSRTDDFETGDDGWTFAQGYARENVTADSGAWSVHSSDGLNDQNDAAHSPIFQKGAGATQVVIATQHDIENPPWDRANVHAVRISDGSHTLLTPTGKTYTVAAWNAVGHVGTDDGWAGLGETWGDATFDLSGLAAGESYYLEINHNTDAAEVGAIPPNTPPFGHWFDNVRWTNVSFQVCDGQSDLCVPCTPPAAPTGLTASATAANQITVTWAAVAPAPSQYRIYRATAMGGPYAQVGTVGGGTLTFDDTGLTPGVTYYYVVRAFETCESANSNEDSGVAFGDCTAAPTFAGLSTVTQIVAGGSCGLRLAWPSGTNNCNSGPLVYNVYRSTTMGFTPGPGNLLQSCVTTPFFDDTSVLGGVTYYYKVRAEDDTVGSGGSCRDGNEDGNTTEGSGMVSGGTETLLFEDFDALAAGALPAGWLSGTFGGSNDWRGARACTGQSSPNVLRYGSATSCTGNYTTDSDALTVTAPVPIPAGSTGVEVEFYHRWEFEANWDGGILYASSAAEFPTFYPIGAAYLSGQGYNDTSIPKGLESFANEKSTGYDAGTMQSTVVDLSQFCADTAQFAADCAGETMYFGFNGYSDVSFTRDGWHVDDVEVRRAGTACTAAPGAAQFLTATASDGQNHLEWLNPGAGAYASTMIRYSTSGYPADPTDGTLLVDQNDGLGAKGSFIHSGLVNGTTYYYSVFVDRGSATYSARKTVSARPFDTSGPVNWAYSTGASALAPPGIGSVYGVANDRVLHSMDSGGTGTWPSGWTPLVMNGPAQSRPPIVPISIGAAAKVAFLGSQDHRVYAVDAESGTAVWSSPDLGAIIQGSPVGIYTAFGGAYDLVMAGTRNSAAPAAFFGLNLADGTIAWSFTNTVAQGGDDLAIGIISSDPVVDWATQRVYFASRERAGGSADTVWCLNFTESGATRQWARALGDVDGSPILSGGRLYVGTNSGEVHALDPATGADLWTQPFDASDGPVKGYVWPRFGTSELLFSTTNRLWSITDNGTGATVNPNWPETAIPNPSIPLAFSLAGTPYVWVGSSDGRLYQLDLSAVDPPASKTSVMLGDGSATVGSPALDVVQQINYVGTEEGRLYAVSLPLP